MRLFYAFWPGPRTRAALEAERARWAWPDTARATPSAGLHVTLHFLGEVDPARLPDLAALLPGLPAAGATLRLDRAEVWRGGIAVRMATQVPAGAAALHAELGRRLAALGLPVESRRWTPHVTLARHATGARPPAEAVPMSWPLRAPVLVQSVPGPGGGYRVVAGTGARALRA